LVSMNQGRQSVKRDEPPNQDPRRLRRRRLAARLTVTELAARAGCNAGYLSQLEHGKYSASARILGALADALSCDITDLMPPEPDTAGAIASAAMGLRQRTSTRRQENLAFAPVQPAGPHAKRSEQNAGNTSKKLLNEVTPAALPAGDRSDPAQPP
jgi:transcriptional regulator with XRE-family HTH domain